MFYNSENNFIKTIDHEADTDSDEEFWDARSEVEEQIEDISENKKEIKKYKGLQLTR